MKHYEQILDKVAPTFFKFATYSHYFLNKRVEVVDFVNFNFDVTRYYSSNKVSYSFITNFDRVNHDWHFIISLRKLNGFMVDQNYGFTDFITTMVINNFSFENKKIVASRQPLYLSLSSKDLFIRLVGKDLYETIRANIR